MRGRGRTRRGQLSAWTSTGAPDAEDADGGTGGTGAEIVWDLDMADLEAEAEAQASALSADITPGESAAAGPTEIDWDTDVSAAAESAGLPAEGADQGPAAASADSAPAQGAPCAAAAPGGAATLLGGATFREALMSELRELRAFVAQGARPLLQSS